MEWRPAGRSVCLPLLIFSCTTKSRSSLLALAHSGGPGKRAVKRLWYYRFGDRSFMATGPQLCYDLPHELRQPDPTFPVFKHKLKTHLFGFGCSWDRDFLYFMRFTNTLCMYVCITQLFTGRMLFLTPNQQCHSTVMWQSMRNLTDNHDQQSLIVQSQQPTSTESQLRHDHHCYSS